MPTDPRPRFDSLAQEVYLNLWRTYDRLRALEDELFAGYDLTAQQYNVLRLLKDRGVPVIQWRDWEVLDAHERSNGEAAGRERVKVVPREDMTDIALSRTKA